LYRNSPEWEEAILSDEHDFAISAGDLQSPADPPAEMAAAPVQDSVSASVSAPPPLVVIQYRNRGLHAALLPPLLILLTALVITSYQRQARLRPLTPPPATSSKAAEPATSAGRGRVIIVEGSVTGAAVEPIMVRAAIPPPPPPPPASVAAPVPPTTPDPLAEPMAEDPLLARADNPLKPGPFSPFDLEAEEGNPTLPTEPGREIAAETPLEPPAPLMSASKDDLSVDSPELAFRVVGEHAPAESELDPKVTKEQIMEGIQVEADQKKADQEDFKREMAQAKSREYHETFRKLQSDRPLFHNDLRRLLQELGDGAGVEINALCDRYGRTTLPEVHKVVVLALNRSAARLKREAKIELMRSLGVPEPVILDYLAKEQHHNMNRRGGPRDSNEVRASAARILLAYPPSRPQASPPKAKSARTPAAPHSMIGVATPSVPRTIRLPQ